MSYESALTVVGILMVGGVACAMGVFGIARWIGRPSNSTQRLTPQIVMAVGGAFMASLPWTWPTLQASVGVFLS